MLLEDTNQKMLQSSVLSAKRYLYTTTTINVFLLWRQMKNEIPICIEGGRTMNKVLKVFLIMVSFSVAVTVLSMTVIFILPNNSLSCLEDYANDYCAESGYTHHTKENRNGQFTCSKDYNVRARTRTSKSFYFSNEEVSNCRIKESFTFKKTFLEVGEGVA